MKLMFLSWILTTSGFSAMASTLSTSSIDQHVRGIHVGQQRLGEGLQSRVRPAALTQGTFAQSIDHFGQLPGQTFPQRYWMDSEYATAGADAPVLFHICGEGDVDQGYFLTDNAIEWAKELGAHLVFLEHRYYGQSLPFSTLTTDHLLYLTVDNVMEDLATFQKWVTAQQGWKGSWISIGGSYSGTLSALYRQKHPELVVGALASSAPMISGIGQSTEGDADIFSSTNPSDDGGGRQWIYQACTELGFWQSDGEDINAELDLPSSQFCQQIFGSVRLYSSSEYNQKYDTPFLESSSLAPSNILFTYGGNDVWTNIGLATQTNQNSRIAITTIANAGHHFDLNAPTSSDSQDVLQAREQFLALAKGWLAASAKSVAP